MGHSISHLQVSQNISLQLKDRPSIVQSEIGHDHFSHSRKLVTTVLRSIEFWSNSGRLSQGGAQARARHNDRAKFPYSVRRSLDRRSERSFPRRFRKRRTGHGPDTRTAEGILFPRRQSGENVPGSWLESVNRVSTKRNLCL